MSTATIRLIVTQGNLGEKEFVFKDHSRCVVGRADDCDIHVPQDLAHIDVSRHHCLLEIDPPSIRVRDLGSRNGTLVNGEPIGQHPGNEAHEPNDRYASDDQELKDGDELQLGSTVLRVNVDSELASLFNRLPTYLPWPM